PSRCDVRPEGALAGRAGEPRHDQARPHARSWITGFAGNDVPLSIDAADGFRAQGTVALRPPSLAQRGVRAARPSFHDPVAPRLFQVPAVVQATRRLYDRRTVADRERQHQGDSIPRGETPRTALDRPSRGKPTGWLVPRSRTAVAQRDLRSPRPHVQGFAV